MTVTRDVILDLLPLYFAGQVSADTRRLVDEFLQSDPDFARMSQRFDSLLKERGGDSAANDREERRVFEKVRLQLRYRNQTIGMAVAYSLAPFLFWIRDGRVEWILLRDRPTVAIAFGLTAVLCWIAAFIISRRAAVT